MFACAGVYIHRKDMILWPRSWQRSQQGFVIVGVVDEKLKPCEAFAGCPGTFSIVITEDDREWFRCLLARLPWDEESKSMTLTFVFHHWWNLSLAGLAGSCFCFVEPDLMACSDCVWKTGSVRSACELVAQYPRRLWRTDSSPFFEECAGQCSFIEVFSDANSFGREDFAILQRSYICRLCEA